MIIGPTDPWEDVNPVDPEDSIEISEAARLATEAMSLDPVRMDKVQELKAAILDGTFETDDRLEAAINRLLASL